MTLTPEKTIIVLESTRLLTSQKIVRQLQKIANATNSTSLIVTLENHVKTPELGFAVKAISDYFDLAVLREKIDEQCTSLLNGLLNDSALKSAFTVDGLFFLRLIREELMYTFLDQIKRILIIQRIIEVEKPSKIVVFENRAFSSETLAPSLGMVVKAVGRKHSVVVTTKHSPLSPIISSLKFSLAPLYFHINSPLTKYRFRQAKSLFRTNHSDDSPQHHIEADKKAVFIPFTDAERVHLEPISKKLCALKDFGCVAIQYPTDFRKKTSANEAEQLPSYLFFKYFARNSQIAKKKKQKLYLAWKKNKKLFYASQALKVDGVDLAKLTQKVLDVDVRYWIKECVNYYITTKEIIKVEKPNCVVASRERELFMRTVLAAVREERVPSVVVQHGIYYDSCLWDSIDATKLCIDEVFKEILLKRGEDAATIEATGPPVYDKILEKLKETKYSMREKIGLSQNKTCLCFLTSLLPEWLDSDSRRSILESLIQSAEKINCDLIVRLHPRENKQEIQDLVANIAKSENLKVQVRVISFEDADLFDVILASDIIAAVRTSALIVGLLAKKPAILINFDNSITDFFPNIEGNIYGLARTPLDLSKLIEEVDVNSAKVKESIEKGYTYARRYVPFDNATDRVVECILELI